MCRIFIFSLTSLRKSSGVELLLAAVLADGVEGGPEEVGVADAGDLDGILEGEEEPSRARSSGSMLQQVLALEEDLALGDLVGVAAGEDAGQGALAGAVGPHDGMDLAGVDLEVDAAEDFLVVDAGVQVDDVSIVVRSPSAYSVDAHSTSSEASSRRCHSRPSAESNPSTRHATSVRRDHPMQSSDRIDDSSQSASPCSSVGH